MAKNVLNCEAIVYKNNKATKIRTGSKSPKTSAGYNLTSLFIGAEGTLGIITSICLKIRKNFASQQTVACQFNTIQQAIDLVVTLKESIQFRRVELLDALQTAACVSFSTIEYLSPNKHTLLIELGGNEYAVAEEVKIIKALLDQIDVHNLVILQNQKSIEEIWMMRKNACPAAIQFIDKNKKAMATDVSVPLSKLNACINNCYQHMNRLGIKAPLVAHVGDGNFHFTILLDPSNELDCKRAQEFSKCIIDESLKLGGTCTGEHGIGLGKKKYLAMEHGDSLFLLEKIKKAFDPLNIFNPGKIINLKNQHLISIKALAIENAQQNSCKL